MSQQDEILARLERIESAVAVNKPVLSIGELSQYTGYTEAYIYRLTSRREIPHYKRGKTLFFSRAEIDQWLMADRVKTRKEIDAEAETYCAINK